MHNFEALCLREEPPDNNLHSNILGNMETSIFISFKNFYLFLRLFLFFLFGSGSHRGEIRDYFFRVLCFPCSRLSSIKLYNNHQLYTNNTNLRTHTQAGKGGNMTPFKLPRSKASTSVICFGTRMNKVRFSGFRIWTDYLKFVAILVPANALDNPYPQQAT